MDRKTTTPTLTTICLSSTCSDTADLVGACGTYLHVSSHQNLLYTIDLVALVHALAACLYKPRHGRGGKTCCAMLKPFGTREPRWSDIKECMPTLRLFTSESIQAIDLPATQQPHEGLKDCRAVRNATYWILTTTSYKAAHYRIYVPKLILAFVLGPAAPEPAPRRSACLMAETACTQKLVDRCI